MKKTQNIIPILAFALGFVSVISQIVLLRELIVVFYGNETAYAIILASWLFWIACGSYLCGVLINKIKEPENFLKGIFLTLFFVLPFSVIAIRFIRIILNVSVGGIIGIIPMCVSSFIIVAPATFLFGGIFTTLCRLPKEQKGVSTVYALEAIGAAVGGLFFSFVLIHIFSAMQMSFIMGILCLLMSGFLKKRKKVILIITVAVSILFFVFVDKFDHWTRQIQWKGFEIVAVKDSLYGNITFTKLREEYVVFENGLLSFSTMDELAAEENVHYALLQHSQPEHVLLIGTGLGGNLKEIFKHPVKSVTYVELDPDVIGIAKEFFPADKLSALEDVRLEVIYADARMWVKQTKKKFDVVLINLPDPHTAMINRYYSLEFFKELDQVLNPSGMISFPVSSSENYLNKETRQFLQSIHTTLISVFEQVHAIPGGINVFLASKKKGALTYQPQVLIERLKNRNIKAKYVQESYIPLKLSRDRIRYVREVLKGSGKLNTDMHPIAYLFNVTLWSTRVNMHFKNMVEKLQLIDSKYLLGVPFLLFMFGWFFKRKSSTIPITLAIATTGLSEIVFQIIVILAFQSLYGFAYYKIGFMMATFMAGVALGSFSAQSLIQNKKEKVLSIFKLVQLSICLYPLLLPVVFVFFQKNSNMANVALFSTVFASLPIIAGFIGGIQYPLANYLLSIEKKNKGVLSAKIAGTLYAVDTFGATIGALVTGAFFIPLFGIKAVAYFCAALNIAVLFLLLDKRR